MESNMLVIIVIEKNKISNTGKTHKHYTLSDETKERMSIARRGKTPWNKKIK